MTRRQFTATTCFAILTAACFSTRADDTEDVKKEIQTQLDLLKFGKAEDLKAHFTARQSFKITPELVAKNKETAEKMTLADLVESVAFGEFEGKKTAKIKMKNGRTLTTLVLTDGKWLADTVWFK